MARITVEDCIELFENRFNLVLVASYRAKAILAGSPPTVERDKDKDAVIALREIAMRTVSTPQLYESCITSYQKHIENDSPVEGLGGSTLDNIESEVKEEISSLNEIEGEVSLDEIMDTEISYENDEIADDEFNEK